MLKSFLLIFGSSLLCQYGGATETAADLSADYAPTVATPAAKDAPATNTEPQVIAMLWGEPITAETTATLSLGMMTKGTGVIQLRLLEHFAQERGITVSDAEVATYTARLQKQTEHIAAERAARKQQLLLELEGGTLNAQQKEETLRQIEGLDQLAQHERRRAEIPQEVWAKGMSEIAKRFILNYKISQQLYHDYGGRIIYQRTGPEPVDAIRDFYKAEQAKGSFVILDPQAEAAFWEPLTRDRHRYLKDPQKIERFANTQWWIEMLPALSEE